MKQRISYSKLKEGDYVEAVYTNDIPASVILRIGDTSQLDLGIDCEIIKYDKAHLWRWRLGPTQNNPDRMLYRVSDEEIKMLLLKQ